MNRNNLSNLVSALGVWLLAALLVSCSGNGPRDVEGATTTVSYKTSAHCAGCKKAIESSLYGLPGVAKADLNLDNMVVTVTFAESITKLEQVENAIRAAGSGYTIEPYDPSKPEPAKDAVKDAAKTDSAAKPAKKDDKAHSSSAKPAAQPASLNTVYYQTDAHCEACKEAIEDKLLALKGVAGANLDLSTKIVRVDLAPSQAPTLAEVEDAIRNAGLGYTISRVNNM